MIYREAQIDDIPQLQVVRNAVTENVLSDPSLVSEQDYVDFLTLRGKGWVCVAEDQIVGFSIVDVKDHNVWALFLKPGKEGQGIGKQLHHMMLDWYFQQTDHTLWLGTAPGTRAERFYRLQGWEEKGLHGKDEIRFEMSAEKWRGRNIEQGRRKEE